MEIMLTLVGVVLGSGATLVAQLTVRRREERERWVGIMLDACASIYMLEDEFMAAAGLFHPPPYFESERFMRWSRRDRALAAARLKLVADNGRVHELEAELRESGRKLWHFARQRGADATRQELAEGLDRHRELLDEFVRVARLSLRRGSLRV
jgi:hypothetical protein